MKIHTNYLKPVFTIATRRLIIDRLATRLRELSKERPFQAIAFSGVSGASVAFSLSDILGVPLINVRKDDDSHYVADSAGTVRYLEGAVDVQSYVFVDDRIASGATARRVMKLIEEHNPQAKCAAILLYIASYGWNTFGPNTDSGVPVLYCGLD